MDFLGSFLCPPFTSLSAWVPLLHHSQAWVITPSPECWEENFTYCLSRHMYLSPLFSSCLCTCLISPTRLPALQKREPATALFFCTISGHVAQDVMNSWMYAGSGMWFPSFCGLLLLSEYKMALANFLIFLPPVRLREWKDAILTQYSANAAKKVLINSNCSGGF